MVFTVDPNALEAVHRYVPISTGWVLSITILSPDVLEKLAKHPLLSVFDHVTVASGRDDVEQSSVKLSPKCTGIVC